MKSTPGWEKNKEMLRKSRSADDKVLRIIADKLGPMGVVQFDRDVKLYNVYEAGMMVSDFHEEIQEELLTIYCPKYIPQSLLDSIANMHAGFVIKSAPAKQVHSAGVFLPDAKWRIRKDMIREKIHILLDEADGKKSRLERIVMNTIQVSTLYASTVAGLKRNAIEAIESSPIKFRLALMARIMKDLDIPDPIDPFAQRKRIFPSRVNKPTRDKIFVIDQAGNSWTWNCGWYRVGDNGLKLDSKPPLGHVKFRRAIKLATAEQLGHTSFRHTRPYGMWRRGYGRVAHELFGNGELEMTDGLHAIVKFDDGLRQEVVLDNLRTIGTRIPRMSGSATSKSTEPKKTAVEKKLEKLHSLLDGIL
jgi:hypothetical protein